MLFDKSYNKTTSKHEGGKSRWLHDLIAFSHPGDVIFTKVSSFAYPFPPSDTWRRKGCAFRDSSSCRTLLCWRFWARRRTPTPFRPICWMCLTTLKLSSSTRRSAQSLSLPVISASQCPLSLLSSSLILCLQKIYFLAISSWPLIKGKLHCLNLHSEFYGLLVSKMQIKYDQECSVQHEEAETGGLQIWGQSGWHREFKANLDYSDSPHFKTHKQVKKKKPQNKTPT